MKYDNQNNLNPNFRKIDQTEWELFQGEKDEREEKADINLGIALGAAIFQNNLLQ